VERHLAYKLTLAQIAGELYVSPSTLSHMFKKEMGISLYQYITQKRLVLAHEQIERGVPPTAAYTVCGYTDYPSFYRAYVKMFGHSPRAKK
jgi:AraC-like DNA-binding protein